MDELANPYRPGAGTAPPALVGRDDLVDRFGVTARRALAGRPGRSLVAVGLRGVGKTVLLNRFCQIAEQEGFSVGFIEAGEHGDLRVALAARLRRILLRLERSGADHVLRALRVLKTFTAQLPDGTRLSLDVDALRGYADSGDLAEDITDLLVAAGEAAGSRGRGVLLAVDEVQYLSRSELGGLISAIHRTTQLELPVLLVGAGLPNLPTLAGQAKTYAERLFEFPEVGALSPGDSRAALLIPAQARGVDIHDAALARMVGATGGYPYFLQEWGYRVWNAATGSPIGTADVRRAEPDVIAHLDGTFFRIRFDRLTAKEKQYLQAMAALGPGQHRSEDVAALLGVRAESVAPRRSALIGKGMIYSPARGLNAFTVALFDQFLLRAGSPGDR
jgi:hypothetical protein